MKKKMLSLILVISMILLSINLIPVSANQYGITIGATAEESGSTTVYIPAGTYHVYISTEALLGLSGSAICSSPILSFSTGNTGGSMTSPHTFESALTINQSGEYTFVAVVNASTGFGYYANFGIVLTDLDVRILTKTGIIGEAPYGLGVIGIALIGITCVHIRRRRHKGS